MLVLNARNGHQAMPEMATLFQRLGVPMESRDGDVLKLPEPTTITYENPQERVVFWAERDANPFFHLFESLYFLSGRRDVGFLERFVSTIKRFSDNGKNFHASYGYRWRKHFGFDQIELVIKALKNNPKCRRQFIMMWDPRADLGKVGKDLPCNIGLTFQINHNGALDLVVFNRSNDAIMGALGANFVHMSILLEYVAAGINVPMGKYWQISSNMHAYTRDLDKLLPLIQHEDSPYRNNKRCPYAARSVAPTIIMDNDFKTWNQDLAIWMKKPFSIAIQSKFFLRVATPMLAAHMAYKDKEYDQALDIIDTQMIGLGDWKIASWEWVKRRKDKHDGK